MNQYIELAVKNNRWKSFKKGVAWASYLGPHVRWLRDEEPTDENLREVFEVMKKCSLLKFLNLNATLIGGSATHNALQIKLF